MTDATLPRAALNGVRVLDLSRVLAGPWATQILGDLGAEVIKIEKPGAGDDTRSWGPPFTQAPGGGEGDAAYYLAANRNKRSVTIDFAHPEGADLVRKLAPHCQIIVENFKTGGLKKYGLDYESVRATNPALVYCSITGFGQTGPYAKRPGYDYMIQAMGGLMSLTGEPDAVTAILAALRHAEQTGEGQHIDVSLLDCQVAMLANLGMNYLVSGEEPQRLGNKHASIAPYQVFATCDGHVVLAVGNDGQFADFCAAAGLDLADDARFAHNAARIANRAELTSAIAAAMLQRTTAHWMTALEQASVPCGPINTLPQVFEDPQVVARGVVQSMTRSDGAEVKLTANPIRMSQTPPRPLRAPPLLGEDTDQTLKEILGLSEATLSRLRQASVL
jgi:crotonobetainyl-CoA:carnitine CoA-transferase CaiB-like acyl-CoA transferase